MKSYWLAFVYLSFSLSGLLHAQEKNRSTSFFSKNPDDLYLGAVMSLKSINSEKHVIKDFSFEEQLNAFSFDIKYEFAPFVPTKQNMYAAIEREFKRVGAPGGSATGSFSSWAVNSLDELDVRFGQNLDLDHWLGLHKTDFPPRSILTFEYEVSLFNLYLDTFDEPFLAFQNQVKKEKDDDLFIVSGLTWGRRALIIVQSDFEESLVRSAFNRFIENEKLSEEDQVIVETAIYSYAVFDDVNLDLGASNPFDIIKKYIDAPITEENFGRVLNITGTNIQNGALIENVYD